MRTLPVAVLASLLAGISIACGGDSGDSGGPAATAPVVTLAPVATGEPGPTPEQAFQSFAYEVRFVAAIESADSRPLTSIERRAEGLFVAPGSHAFAGGLGVVGQTPPHQGVVIGDRAWYREGDGAWQEMPASQFKQLGASALTSVQPGFLNDAAFEDKLEGLDFTAENSSGVTAHRYNVPPEEVDRIGSLLRIALLQDISGLEDVDLTVWTSEETGALLRVEFSTLAPAAAVLGQVPENIPAGAKARVTLRVELSRINDSTIRIAPPI